MTHPAVIEQCRKAGLASAAALTPEQRSARARKAAKARKRKKEPSLWILGTNHGPKRVYAIDENTARDKAGKKGLVVNKIRRGTEHDQLENMP